MLIGQQQAETILARAVAADRVGQTYLFLGPSSAGKATAARLFAQAINCEGVARWASGIGAGRAVRLEPCAECESCRRIAAGKHPEVLDVIPGSKTGQNISIDQARDIRMNASLRPKLGRRRVYIIPNAEAFNEESANCLLKTLEEPPESVTLILCAPNPSQVLPTVRSRCQIVRFGIAPADEIARALEARGAEPSLAAALARASGGRPGLAISWIDDPAFLGQRSRILDLFAQALALQAPAARQPSLGARSLRLAEKLGALVPGTREKDDEEGPARPAKVLHRDNLETGLTYLRDLLLLSEGAGPELAQNQDRLPELQDLAPETVTARLLDDIRIVRESQQLLDRNVAPQLVLERMFWGIIAGRVPLPEPLFQETAA